MEPFSPFFEPVASSFSSSKPSRRPPVVGEEAFTAGLELLHLVPCFSPECIDVSAFIGCAVAFGCFSAAAMVARHKEYLYFGGLLSCGLSILFWLHFTSSIFGGSMALFKFELYFELLVFVGYIVVDTQDIIEKAHFGDLDYVKHTLTLFTDFVAVFVRILIIVLKNASEKEEKRRPRRRRRRRITDWTTTVSMCFLEINQVLLAS